MFLDHFGLSEQPFGVTPDPHFLYFSPSHLEAAASLFYGIQTQRGFMALIAQPGMGKTTLLFHLLEHLRDSARTAFLFQAHHDSREFLRSLMTDLGVNDQDDDLGRMHRKLNEFLIREVRAGRRVVVVIDEAQNLEDSNLALARLRITLATGSGSLVIEANHCSHLTRWRLFILKAREYHGISTTSASMPQPWGSRTVKR